MVCSHGSSGDWRLLAILGHPGRVVQKLRHGSRTPFLVGWGDGVMAARTVGVPILLTPFPSILQQPFPRKFPFSELVPRIYNQIKEFIYACLKFSEDLHLRWVGGCQKAPVFPLGLPWATARAALPPQAPRRSPPLLHLLGEWRAGGADCLCR